MKKEKTTHLLPVMEVFDTIQGEGHYTGTAAYFVRLGGCDVGCVWCDVKESWDASQWPTQTPAEITKQALQQTARTVVVTGGEPLIYDLNELTTSLQKEGFRTHLETAGVYPFSGNWDWVCFSPKKFKKPLDEFYKVADELKVVVYHQSDLQWAEEHAAKAHNGCELYLQPEWDRSEKLLPQIIDYVKNNPKWKISLQTHKFMNIP